MINYSELHIPVLTKEIISFLRLQKGMAIVDCTVGAGGHAVEILKRIGDAGILIGIDKDGEILEKAKSRLAGISKSFRLFHCDYKDIDLILKKADVPRINGALLDLGASSFQMDLPDRGFSINLDGPLDMRMDRKSGLKASDIVNRLARSDLADLFKKYGDEHLAYRVAERIVRERKRQRIDTTARLAEVVTEALPYRFRFRKIHPATKVFMALRIAVNGETESLRAGLSKIMPFLDVGARICVISFHSIEDRIVKNSFKEYAARGELKIVTKKPILPCEEEKRDNPRSRSAKLRVAERIGGR